MGCDKNIIRCDNGSRASLQAIKLARVLSKHSDVKWKCLWTGSIEHFEMTVIAWTFIFLVLVQLCVVFAGDCDGEGLCGTTEGSVKRPNIIFILADDAGWNDFSFHGSPQIPTPNIDAIALNGAILNGYYSAPLCTPSRGMTLTGKFAIHIALQHYVILSGTPVGLPLTEKLLPEYLKELDYETHLVGKWHLGHARKAYTPTYRGFDSHFGYYLGAQDYYSHMMREQYGTGYDFRSNLTVNRQVFGKYNTDIFTDEAIRLIKGRNESRPIFLMISHTAPHSTSKVVPLQAPEENVQKFNESIENIGRRRYAGLVDKLDESVGRVMEALAEADMLQESILVFASDNGGAPEGYDRNQGSNWPLRGTKNTLWEGGTRLAACIWSPKVKPGVHNFQMHSADWLPTLLDAATDGEAKVEYIDGMSQWKALQGLDAPPRNTFLYNIDDLYNNSAVRYGNWKLVQGNTSSIDLGGCPNGTCDSWFGPSGRPVGPIDMKSLLKAVLNSPAGKSFARAGFPINLSRAKVTKQDAVIECGDIEEIPCNAYESPCLFDVEADPCERRNLAKEEPEVVEFLQSLIEDYRTTAVEPIKRWSDPNCSPMKWDYTWTYFKDLMDEQQTNTLM